MPSTDIFSNSSKNPAIATFVKYISIPSTIPTY
jgi:hypothetical protein